MVAGGTTKGYGCPGLSMFEYLAIAEIVRVDATCSLSVFVHCSLPSTFGQCHGFKCKVTSIFGQLSHICMAGNFEGFDRDGIWKRCKLTQHHCSEGGWVLNGQKLWIGNNTVADLCGSCFCTQHNHKPNQRVLAISRIMVAWQPIGIAMGVYDICHRRVQKSCEKFLRGSCN